MIRHLKKLAARVVNHVARRVIDGHNARTAAQSRQAVEQAWAEKTPVSPRAELYVVHFGHSERRAFDNWPDARDYYELARGYGITNETHGYTGDGHFEGLTEEQRGEIGL